MSEPRIKVEIDQSVLNYIRDNSGLSTWGSEEKHQCADIVLQLGIATFKQLKEDEPDLTIRTLAKMVYGLLD